MFLIHLTQNIAIQGGGTLALTGAPTYSQAGGSSSSDDDEPLSKRIKGKHTSMGVSRKPVAKVTPHFLQNIYM